MISILTSYRCNCNSPAHGQLRLPTPHTAGNREVPIPRRAPGRKEEEERARRQVMQDVLVMTMRSCCVIMMYAWLYTFLCILLMPVCRAAEMGCSHLAAFHKVKKHLSKVKVENKKKVKKKNKGSDIEEQIGWLLIRIVLWSKGFTAFSYFLHTKL